MTKKVNNNDYLQQSHKYDDVIVEGRKNSNVRCHLGNNYLQLVNHFY